MTGDTPYRLTVLGESQFSDAQREVVAELVSGPRGGVVGPYDAWLRRPDLARRARLLGDYCRFDAQLPRGIAEMVILVAGRYWDAPFEFAAHAPLAHQAGVAREVIDAIRFGRHPVFDDPRAEAAYELVVEYFESHRVTDPTYRRAVEVLGEEMLVDVVAVAGFYALVCMTLNVFAVPLPEGVQNPFSDGGRTAQGRDVGEAENVARPV